MGKGPWQKWYAQRGFWQDAIYRFSRNKLAVAGLITSI